MAMTNNVHKQTILVLTKEKSVYSFGNKIKSKFQEVYLCMEYRAAIDLIEANSAQAKKPLIDLVIVDCDITNSLKLIEYVRKRPLDVKFSHLPLIAVVVMVSDENIKDRDFSFTNYRNLVESVGGAHRYVDMQKSNFQECVAIVNTVASRKYKIDVAYQDLKQNHKRSKKIPYFPIFGRPPGDHDDILDIKSPNKNSDDPSGGSLNASSGGGNAGYPLSLTGATDEELFLLNLPSLMENTEKVKKIAEEKPQIEKKKNMPNFADPRFRPKLNLHLPAAKSPGKDALKFKGSSEESRNEVLVDLRQLLTRTDREEKDHSRLTLGGIDKEVAAKYWNDSTNMWQIADPKLKRPDTASSVGDPSNPRPNASRDNQRVGSSGGDNNSTIINNTNNRDSNYGDGASQVLILDKTVSQDRPVTPFGSPKAKMNQQPDFDTGTISHFDSTSLVSDSNFKKKSGGVDLKAALKRNIRETPLDLKLHNIIEVDLSTRSLSVAERELLEHGYKNELEGDIARCTFLYSKAAAFLREAHLPKVFLGNLHFKQWKYFQALQFYNQAVHKLSLEIPGHYCVEDDFVAHFNRAVTKIRMGADEEGIIDLEHALSLQPRNLIGLELLKVVQRRLGKYKESFAINKQMDGIIRTNRIESQELLEQQEVRKLLKSPNKKLSKDVSPKNLDHDDDEHVKSDHLKNADMNLVQIVVPDPKGNLSMSEKKLVNATDGIAAVNPDESQDSLSSYRIMYGFKADIHTTLFMKPSPLQQALLCTPDKRMKSKTHCGTITDALRTIPYLMSLSLATVTELAPLVEYRLFDTSVNLFDQNEKVKFICLPIRGKLLISQVNHLENIPISTKICELQQNALYGHIDLLFHDKQTPFYAEMKRYVDEVDEGAKTATDGDGDGIMHTLFQEEEARHKEDEARSHKSHDSNDNHVNNKHEHGYQQSSVGDDAKKSINKSGDLHLETNSIQSDNKKGNGANNGAINLANNSDVNGKLKNSTNESTSVEPEGYTTDRPMTSSTNKSTDRPKISLQDVENRALSSQCYCSAEISDASEVILMTPDTFNRYIFPIACLDLKQRIECITASGLMNGWLNVERLRFARMGFVFTFNSGDIVLEQRDRPDYLYFVMTGMLKAYKKPTLIEIIERKLVDLRAKADRFDLKYAFHHKLRFEHFKNENSLESVKEGGEVPDVLKGAIHSSTPVASTDGHHQSRALKTSSTIPIAPSKLKIPDLESIDVFWDNRDHKLARSKGSEALLASINKKRDLFGVPYDHTSISEKARQAIELEIKSLEIKYQRALLEQQQTLGGESVSKTYTGGSIDGTVEDDDDDEGVLKNRCEIAVLKWPMIFGEDSVLDCDHGCSRGAIIAETPVKVFAIHKNQLQTFKLGSDFSDRVAVRMVNYPEDDVVLESIVKRKKWKHYRNQMMKTIPTTRWPKQNDEADPFLP